MKNGDDILRVVFELLALNNELSNPKSRTPLIDDAATTILYDGLSPVGSFFVGYGKFCGTGREFSSELILSSSPDLNSGFSETLLLALSDGRLIVPYESRFLEPLIKAVIKGSPMTYDQLVQLLVDLILELDAVEDAVGVNGRFSAQVSSHALKPSF